jgi:hypothetical protein
MLREGGLPQGTPAPSPTTLHFVPLPRRVLPTARPLFSPGQNCRPRMIHPILAVGVRTTRSRTRARSAARNPAPPNRTAVAGRSRDAGTRPANPASGRRCAESTKCLPALCGRWPAVVPLRTLGSLGKQGLDRSPLRVGQQPTVSRHRPSPWRCAPFLSPSGEPNYGNINALYPVLQPVLALVWISVFASRALNLFSV